MREVIARAWFGVWLGCCTAVAAQIPSDVMVDRYLLQARMLSEENARPSRRASCPPHRGLPGRPRPRSAQPSGRASCRPPSAPYFPKFLCRHPTPRQSFPFHGPASRNTRRSMSRSRPAAGWDSRGSIPAGRPTPSSRPSLSDGLRRFPGRQLLPPFPRPEPRPPPQPGAKAKTARSLFSWHDLPMFCHSSPRRPAAELLSL